MRTRALAAGAALAAISAATAVVVAVAAGGSAGGAAAPSADSPPPAAAPAAADGEPSAPASTAAVEWVRGPWPAVDLGGSPLLVPVAADGPLVDHGGGWKSGYEPTAAGAAVAALRHGAYLAAAPPALRPAVEAASLTPAGAQAYKAPLGPDAFNAAPDWAVPPAVLASAPPGTTVVVGAVADLGQSADGPAAAVDVYLVTTPPGPVPRIVTVRATYRMVYGGGEWRMDAPRAEDAPAAVAAPPASFTVPGPPPEALA